MSDYVFNKELFPLLEILFRILCAWNKSHKEWE